MREWQVWAAAAAALLWILALGLTRRTWQRNGRSMLRDQIDRDVNQLRDTPEGIARRMADAPGDPVAAIKHARLAEAAQDWPEALARGRLVARLFPRLQHGPMIVAHALWNDGAHGEARRMTNRLRRRFPEDWQTLEFSIVQARSFQEWPLVVRLGRRMRRRFAAAAAGYGYEAEGLIALGRLEAAGRALRRAELAFPGNAEIAKLWQTLAEVPVD